MKSQKGITLTSLVIYILVTLIVLGILATITANFQSNVKEINREGTGTSEIDKFNIYFLKEVKREGNRINTITNNQISFTTGNTYAFESNENAIYLRNGNRNIKISENIESCNFSSDLENGKTVIVVRIKAINSELKVESYVLYGEENSTSYEDENRYVN